MAVRLICLKDHFNFRNAMQGSKTMREIWSQFAPFMALALAPVCVKSSLKSFLLSSKTSTEDDNCTYTSALFP